MNSYFASVEQQANPFLRGKAIGVTGKRKERSVVAAASREAKKLGVKTAMSTWEAKRVLPSILLVMGDPEKYGDITRRFNAVFREFTNLVEPFSVDESFLDVTDTARDYLGATVIAQMIRRRLREECGACVTASIGIAPNKAMAKLASERMKPDGLVVAPPDRVVGLLDGSELEDVCGIGPRIAARLRGMGIASFRELRARPLADLVAQFHSYGEWLHHVAHGRGDDVVSPDADDPKSYGHSYTLPTNATDPRVIERYLLVQCDKVAWRMRRDGCAARCVTASLRFGDFSGDGRQRRTREPINDGLKLFEIAKSLVYPLLTPPWQGEKRASPPAKEGLRGGMCRPVRLVGVSASELTRGAEQISLFKKERKMSSVLSALDALQTRYGDRAWTRASLLNTSVLARTSGFRYDHEL